MQYVSIPSRCLYTVLQDITGQLKSDYNTMLTKLTVITLSSCQIIQIYLPLVPLATADTN